MNDLMDLLAEQGEKVPTLKLRTHRKPRTGPVHVLVPSMHFACGGNMLDLPEDRWVMGAGQDAEWAKVTCEDCRNLGRREIRRVTHRQQKPPEHVCTDECPWTTTPEEKP